jgi:pimeloyl-ACP methyl ester carboxylesterase
MDSDSALLEQECGYVPVGDLRLYYESRGEGAPLLLLHGGMSTIESAFGGLREALAPGRKIVAIEQQGHGHTADLDRPLRYDRMVEESAAVLAALGLDGIDVFGWSDGGIVGLGLAARHPRLVRRIAICGAGYSADAESPEAREKYQRLRADGRGVARFREAYQRVAPRPEDWGSLVEKCKEMWRTFEGWPADEMRAIAAPLLVMAGDSDSLRLEHALELYRMVPRGQLAVLPGSDHGVPIARADLVAAILADFFNAPDAVTE